MNMILTQKKNQNKITKTSTKKETFICQLNMSCFYYGPNYVYVLKCSRWWSLSFSPSSLYLYQKKCSILICLASTTTTTIIIKISNWKKNNKSKNPIWIISNVCLNEWMIEWLWLEIKRKTNSTNYIQPLASSPFFPHKKYLVYITIIII